MTTPETGSTNLRRGRRPIGIALICATLALNACGSSDDATSTSGTVSTAGSESSDPTDAATLQETGPVTFEGAPLAEFGTVPDAAIGEAAPVVSGESFDGTPITVGGVTDRPTLVVFLAHWCPHCNDEVPVLTAMNDAGQIPDGLDVIGVSTAARADAPNYPPSEWIAEKGWPWPTMADDGSASAFTVMGGSSFPYMVVLGTDGHVLARRSGEAPADEMVAFLDAALTTA